MKIVKQFLIISGRLFYLVRHTSDKIINKPYYTSKYEIEDDLQYPANGVN